MKIDYLIVGQGLAGSLLAWELIKRKKKVIVVDKGEENASQIAAGLINPITGIRFVKSMDIDQLLPSAIDYYKQLAQHFGQTFYIEKTMLRILGNNNELAIYQKRQQQVEYQDYLAGLLSSSPFIQTNIGILQQKQTGYLLTKPLLKALKNYFISIQAYICSNVNYNDIYITQSFNWKNIYAKQIIFCQGHHATVNPWFSWLPFQPVKGEIITASTTQKIPHYILNYGHWFIPINSSQFRIGATFDRENLNTETTIKAKQILLKSLKKVCPSITTKLIVNQKAGIRPTTLDKQPFIGIHPKHPELVVFNGFGAKGSLQIPWFCQRLADHLLDNTPLPRSSNILRYFKPNELE
jgi:glycine/D-amino acid oxidase-like deaminating enzyme